MALSTSRVMEWNISRRSPYRDEERLAMDDGFLASRDSCRFRADGRPTFLAAASVLVFLALAPSSTAPESLCAANVGRGCWAGDNQGMCARGTVDEYSLLFFLVVLVTCLISL